MSKKIFITGATGFIGEHLALRLATEGHRIVALVRTPEKAAKLNHPNISIVMGDLFNIQALEEGMKNVGEVYHLAAFAKVWAKDDSFKRVNVDGTINVLEVAKKQDVARIVITSTAGVIGPSVAGPATEENERAVDFFNDYERTKFEAEEKTKEFVAQGMHIVTVNPTRVFGPGELSVSNSVTTLIKQYAQGKWRVMPADGKSSGNYVFIDDVVNGHILAMAKGVAGERYILGGEDASYEELFATIAECTGKRYRLIKIPYGLLMLVARIQMLMAGVFGLEPTITPGWVRKFLYHWSVSSRKAQKELGYTITPLKESIQKTLDWLANS